MSVKILSVAPQARCYVCGSIEIAAVCHHCGHAMCSSHGPESVPSTNGIHVLEFSDIDIRELRPGQPAAHCNECIHYVQEPLPWLISQGWGFILLFASIGAAGYGIAEEQYRWAIAIGIVGILLGAFVVFSYRVIKPRSIRNQMLGQKPRFPMLGNFKCNLQEKITGKISLSDMGEYNVSTELPSGKLEYTLLLTPRNKEQLERFAQKYNVNASDNMPADGGTLIIRGRPNLTYDNPDESILPERAQTLVLRSQTRAFPFLTDSARRDREWVANHEYTVYSDTIPSSGPDALPFTIVPTLVMEGAHRAITFDINIIDTVAFPQLQEMVKIEWFTVDVPASLGQVRNSNPSTRTSRKTNDDGEFAYQQVIWRDLPVTIEDRTRRYKSFYLSFENSIEPEMVFRGYISVQFKGTLSGSNGLYYFNPLGLKQAIDDTHTTSSVETAFEQSLESLRFQEDISFQDTFTKENILPTYQVVTELTDTLSKQGFYFKQFIENPETTSSKRAYTMNRYWDLEGRLYQGVYPIDFHLILKGEAALRPQEDGFLGDLTSEISVKGTATNDAMRNEVQSVFDQLAHNTREILERISENQSQIDFEYSPPIVPDDANSQFAASSNSERYNPQVLTDTPMLQSISQTVRSAIQDFFKGIMVVSIPSEQSNSQIAPESKDGLSFQERLDRLMNALLNGYISENMYQKLRVEIETERENMETEGGA